MCVHHVCYFLLFVLIIFSMSRSCLGTTEFRSPSPEFHKHSIVRPTLLHGRTKREILTTEHTNGEHHPEIDVSLPIAGEQWVLELKLNEHLLAHGHTLQYEHGGKIVKHLSTKEELNLCHYSGSVRGRAQSWAAVSTCRGVRGVIFDGRATLYIEPAEGSDSNALHYLYHHKDLKTDRFRCSGVQHDPEINRNYETDYISKLRPSQRYEQGNKGRNQTKHKRTTPTMNSRELFHPDPKPRYLELMLVADKSTYEACGRDERVVQAKLIELVNIVNSIFTPLNIYITLVAVVVWSEGDKITLSRDAEDTTKTFVEFDLVTTTPYDISFLFTNFGFDKGIAGEAYNGVLCKPSNHWAGGVVLNYTAQIGLVATVFAHELGHSFGMKHDGECLTNYCPDEYCIMHAHGTSTMHWSDCSLKALKETFEKKLDHCLHNKPELFLNRLGPKCGNGMTETGEQCDCGSIVYGGLTPCHACCDPDTCMLRQNATCAAGTCCDLDTCRLKSADVVCRSAEGECDLPEYCSGDFEHCPRNVYKMDSTPCWVGKDRSHCMSGKCRSGHSQCQLVWGANASSDEECYALKNPAGDMYGNCGYDHSTSTYKPCKVEDAPCGLLQCHTDGHNCTIARTGGSNTNPDNVNQGRVPDGASCGNDKMCLDQRCVPLESVQERISRFATSVCPSDCSGHGICNSEGHCHCDNDYAPPLCASTAQKIIKTLMYVLFFGIIPSIVLLLVLRYYSRDGALWKQMKNAYYLSYAKCSCKKMTENRKNEVNAFKITKDMIHIITDNDCKAISPITTLSTEINYAKSSCNNMTENRKNEVNAFKITKDMIHVITDNDSKAISPITTLSTEIKMPCIGSELKKPMLDLVDDEHIQIRPNGTKSDSAKLSYNDNTNCLQHAIDNVKLKPVKPAAKNNIQQNHIQTMLNNVKLTVGQKTIHIQESKVNDDNQINITAIDLKKPKPLSSKTIKTPLKPVSNKHADTHYPIQNHFLKPTKKAKNNNGNTRPGRRTDFNAKSECLLQKPILKPLSPVSHINKQLPKNETKNPKIKNDDPEVCDDAPLKYLISLFEPEMKPAIPAVQPETNFNNVKPAILKKPVTRPIKPYTPYKGGEK